MTEDFEIEALQYLLHEMDASRRAAFEARLARDPMARAALKSCGDALARFACETAPAEPMAAADQRAALAAIMAAARAERPVVRGAGAKVVPFTHYLWPIAAAILLALNFLDFDRPVAPSVMSGRESEPLAATPPKGEKARAGEVASASPVVDPESDPDEAPAGIASGTDAPALASGGMNNVVENLRQLDRLRKDYAELARSNAALRAEYDAIIRHLADRTILERNLGRLAAMELVDAATYERGDRRGLVEIARGILTEPGVVVATPDPVDPPLDPGLGPAIADGEVPSTPPTYAWAVFDEKEHRGYLNLYNLPTVPSDQVLQLWVKPIDSVTFQPVGEVPAQFQGGNGSLHYTLPETTMPPAEILITSEPRGVEAASPTGPVVLRGP